MGVRKEIRSLSKTELDKFRAAFNTLRKDKTNAGYQAIAGYHGCPEFRCPHHDLKFLPWHRIYILQIEKGLQKIDKTVSLPYWDWGSNESIAQGMPTAYTAKTSNPLLNSPINAAGKAPCQGVQSPTFRDPDDPGDLEQYRDQVTEAMKEKTFATFSSAIEAPHDNIHVWVGGSMGAVISAAFDPIFWAHHCNIDRLWAAWQEAGGPDPKAPFVNTKLLPKFDVTVKQTLSIKALGYSYAKAPSVALPKFNNAGVAELAMPKARTFLSIRVAELSAESFQLRVFVNQPDATVDTPTKGNPNFVGRIGIFGVGAPLEAHDHAAHDHASGLATADAETSKDLPPKEHKLDITNIVEQIGDAKDLKVKIVAMRLDGSPADANETPVAGVTVKRE